MIATMISSILGMFLLFFSNMSYCEVSSIPAFLELKGPNHNSWVVNGLLQNEQQEAYGFLFKVERLHQNYHASAAIYDLNNRQILWHQDASSTLCAQDLLIEKIGPFFWHYSMINSSLIIGYQDLKRQVFNLKLDLIEPTTLYKELRPTADLKIKEFWSGSINGHININHEEFVNSSNAWIQNLSQDDNLSNKSHDIHELLCKFQDGQSLFALQIPEKNASKAAITSLYNANGEKQLVSQFINLKRSDTEDYRLELHHDQNPLHMHAIFAHQDYNILHAQDTKTQNQGYCVYLQNPWQTLLANEPLKLPPPKQLSLIEKTIALGKKPFKIPFLMKNKMAS